jgi:hypothetical protein
MVLVIRGIGISGFMDAAVKMNIRISRFREKKTRNGLCRAAIRIVLRVAVKRRISDKLKFLKLKRMIFSPMILLK